MSDTRAAVEKLVNASVAEARGDDDLQSDLDASRARRGHHARRGHRAPGSPQNRGTEAPAKPSAERELQALVDNSDPIVLSDVAVLIIVGDEDGDDLIDLVNRAVECGQLHPVTCKFNGPEGEAYWFAGTPEEALAAVKEAVGVA